MNLDEADATYPTLVMGLTNTVTAWLPGKWSRFFPLIPVVLGLGYGILRESGAFTERVIRALTGPMAIAQYSLLRNAAGTKPKDK